MLQFLADKGHYQVIVRFYLLTTEIGQDFRKLLYEDRKAMYGIYSINLAA